MQDWKHSEKDFEDSFEKHGKAVFVHRLTDTAVAKAISGSGAFVAAQPSDYLVTLNGLTFFAEVKSTVEVNSFPFSNIQKKQMASSRRIIAAGGAYFFYIHARALDLWFKIPAGVIHEIAKVKKSATWIEVEQYVHVL